MVAVTEGTTAAASVVRVVDGDTVVVTVEGVEERIRLAGLDTEESNHGSDKPVTPWGKKAKDAATELLPPGTEVLVEFGGKESVQECLRRYRDNFGRLLVWLHKGDVDVQEYMIGNGYSPYFTKYGHADFAGHHQRYTAAERDAQAAHVGVWDQLTVNGSEMRNYALLGVWWNLRAELIDDYRAVRAERPELLNSRLDYERIAELAAQGQDAVVFTELRGLRRLGQRKAAVEIGSQHQPFKLFIPDIEADAGQDVVRLLDNRYFAPDDLHPRRSYAYVSGRLKTFNDQPELVIDSRDQITDTPA